MSKIKHNPEEKTSIDPAFFDQRQQPFNLSAFIYNKKEGTYFGRTTDSWGKEMDANCCVVGFFVVCLLEEKLVRDESQM